MVLERCMYTILGVRAGVGVCISYLCYDMDHVLPSPTLSLSSADKSCWCRPILSCKVILADWEAAGLPCDIPTLATVAAALRLQPPLVRRGVRGGVCVCVRRPVRFCNIVRVFTC